MQDINVTLKNPSSKGECSKMSCQDCFKVFEYYMRGKALDCLKGVYFDA